jgi:Holliday junction DNA helicase RuvB
MARETILQSAVPPGDDEEDKHLRPQRMGDMVGQHEVIERLRIVIDAAKKRGEPLGHILFDGPPGLGKTTFATVIPREMNVPIAFTSGPVIKAPRDLVPYLTNASEHSVLFIDEIHRLPTGVEEYLYTAMEDFRIDIVLGEGVNARTHNLWLKPFTLIGATTRAGMLSSPLRDRFQVREHLGFYTVEELGEIVRRNARKLKTTIDAKAQMEIACRSRGTPRVANNLLRWVRDYAQSKADGKVTLALAKDALLMKGVDELGLNPLDRNYLQTIIRVFGGGPAGIEAIAHTMNAASDTLTDDVEPFLLRSEMIVRSPRGRVATVKAFNHLQMNPPARPGDEQGRLFG